MKIVNKLTTSETYFVLATDWSHRRHIVEKVLRSQYDQVTGGNEVHEISVVDTNGSFDRVRVTLRTFNFDFVVFDQDTAMLHGLDYNKEKKE